MRVKMARSIDLVKALLPRGATVDKLSFKLVYMLEVPGVEGEPTLKLFDNVEELREFCGEKFTHGFFDPAQNLIVATVHSVAHEIGHYRDFKSGKMKVVTNEMESQERIRSRIRNEIVAVLFAYQRVSDRYGLFPYEREFIEWVVFHWPSDDFKSWRERSSHVAKLKFDELQELAEWLVDSKHSWGQRLEVMFQSYLKQDHEVMTYSI